MRRAGLIAAVASVMLAAAPAAWAETLRFVAHLDGAQETPPNTSAGTGDAQVTLNTDTKALTWTITYSGLSGPATMAHFHGPAPKGVAAGVVIKLGPPVDSPIQGGSVLNSEQVQELMTGQLYVNVHTAAHPAGEIRGQVVPAS
jgi:hypothetical protein